MKSFIKQCNRSWAELKPKQDREAFVAVCVQRMQAITNRVAAKQIKP